MPSPLLPFASTPAACARQRALQQRLRYGAMIAAGCMACVLGLALLAYLSNGIATALALLIAGCALAIEALRQADGVFIAPLQARCQADFGIQVRAALNPLLNPGSCAEPVQPEATRHQGA